ncbi:MAG: endonuclease/exonuclease/phosphatase family protein [Deltaproteobacteria bacterium]|nr:endonuclease/exonuclease/phosphatase family protein [Deltaproteobacteria bacterium]
MPQPNRGKRLARGAAIPAGLRLGLLVALCALAQPVAARTPAPALRWDVDPATRSLGTLAGQGGGLRLLWWNVQRGELNAKLTRKGQLPPLDANLQALSSSRFHPDVIVLGEYQQGILRPETRAALARAYPHQHFQPYNAGTPNDGLLLLSRHALSPEQARQLGYAPPGSSPEQAERYRQRWEAGYGDARYFDKPYLRVGVHLPDGRRVELVPFHAIQPWDKLRQERGGGLWGFFRTSLDIVFGRKNPLMNQVHALRANLAGDFGRDLSKSNVVLFGDLNFMRSALRVPTKPYRTISKGLVDPFRGRPAQPSWPSRSAGETSYPGLQLDQVFTSASTVMQASGVLPLKGSDHYPLMMVLQ